MSNDRQSPGDGTGTVDGGPELVTIVALEGCDDTALLALAASLADGLETPAAAACLVRAREREIQPRRVDWFHSTSASGVAASVAGHTVVLGDAALMEELGLSVENLGDWPDRSRRRGEQVLFVAVDGRTRGFLGFADAGV
jgi:Cu+-exporting ATPase